MNARNRSRGRKTGTRGRSLVKRLLLFPVVVLGIYYGFCTVALLLYNFITPPITGVQLQRQVEALFDDEPYQVRYDPVPLSRISKNLQHAAIAAEDGGFYDHFGIDWNAVQKAVEDNRRRGRSWRGGSTITQQLVKNLFMTTHSSYVRKALEVPLTYLAEILLPKDRILMLYLNVIEWGRGVYGAEAAARHHYDTSAARLTRLQAASLAACIPNPRYRTPQRMGAYARTIQRRMRALGY